MKNLIIILYFAAACFAVPPPPPHNFKMDVEKADCVLYGRIAKIIPEKENGLKIIVNVEKWLYGIRFGKTTKEITPLFYTGFMKDDAEMWKTYEGQKILFLTDINGNIVSNVIGYELGK